MTSRSPERIADERRKHERIPYDAEMEIRFDLFAKPPKKS